MKAMIRNMAIALSTISLVGCGTLEIPINMTIPNFVYSQEENQQFSEVEGESVSNVKWVRYADQGQLNRVCGSIVGIPAGPTSKFWGCAKFDRQRGNCTIYTHTNTTHQIFGHELRHCFQGNFH